LQVGEVGDRHLADDLVLAVGEVGEQVAALVDGQAGSSPVA
jgi:hypothetical protein